VSRTVGWFTALYPVQLDIRDRQWPGEVLTSVKEQLRQVPRRGIGYGLLRYLGPDRELAARLEVYPEIRFNYLGQLAQQLPVGSAYALALESRGLSQSHRAQRTAVLAISGSVVQDRLLVTFSYSCHLHARPTIERWGAGYLAALRQLIVHCHARDTQWTPSDFPLAQLDQGQFDQVARLLERIDRDPT
jgi:non-ribosomal peptide synthase protein (TIGR01720 family)